MWLALSILGTLDRQVTDKLTAYLSTSIPTYGALAGDLASWAIEIAVIMLFSSFALRLPAVAMQDAAFTLSIATIRGRKMWPGLPVGLVLSLAPIPLVAWGVAWVLQAGSKPEAASAHHVLDASDAVFVTAWMLVLLATLVSGATFLTRAYLAAKSPTASA